MKRDMDLIRKILFKIEKDVDNTAEYDIAIEGYNIDQVAYHCSILYDDGYIKDYNAVYGSDGVDDFGVSRLTWKGHEFLDKIKDDNIWEKTKETVKLKGLPMVVDVIKDVATAIITGMTQAAIQNLK